jgi:8-oxo-dGTP diphosphatase
LRNIVNALLLKDESVLLARRSPKRKAYPNLWSFPGGHVEAGETLEQALSRELVEEIGIVPLIFNMISRISDPNAIAVPITYHLFAIRSWSGCPTILDNEHTHLQWFALDDARALPDLALDEYRLLFAALQDQNSPASRATDNVNRDQS